MAIDLTGIGTAAEAAKGILGMFFEDKTEAEKARIAAVFAVMQSQNDVNKVEAANPSVWTSGWRPYVGWVCGTALAACYIPKALVMTGIWVYQCIVIMSHWSGLGAVPVLPLYPDLGVTDLIGLLMSLLGMAGLRSLDKKNGVAS
jgi:hypothetical protein